MSSAADSAQKVETTSHFFFSFFFPPCSAYLSAVTANNGVWPPLQCVKAPVLSTDRPWTLATSTASSTAPRSRAAFTSWSRGFLGNCLRLLEESQREQVSHTLSFTLCLFSPSRSDDFKKVPPLDAKKLEVFRTVREITGFLHTGKLFIKHLVSL